MSGYGSTDKEASLVENNALALAAEEYEADRNKKLSALSGASPIPSENTTSTNVAVPAGAANKSKGEDSDEDDDEEDEEQKKKAEFPVIGATPLLLLTGFLVGSGGVALVSSAYEGALFSFNAGDTTRVLYADGLWCKSGVCRDISSGADADSCEDFADFLNTMRGVTMTTGICMLVMVSLASIQMLLRGAVALVSSSVTGGWRKWLRDCDKKCKKGLRKLRKGTMKGLPIPAAITFLLGCTMIAFAIIILIMTEQLRSTKVPCPGSKGIFNHTLHDIAGFDTRRGVWMNYYGSACVIFSSGAWMIWGGSMVGYVQCKAEEKRVVAEKKVRKLRQDSQGRWYYEDDEEGEEEEENEEEQEEVGKTPRSARGGGRKSRSVSDANLGRNTTPPGSGEELRPSSTPAT